MWFSKEWDEMGLSPPLKMGFSGKAEREVVSLSLNTAQGF